MTLRVCIVDDDQDIRESLRILLEDSDVIVEEAVGGEAALDLLRASAAPRVLLLDRVMPGMSGVQVLRTLAQAPELQRRTAIVFMTARPDPPDAALTALLHSLDALVLAKPYDIEDVLNMVERAWQLITALQRV